MPKTELRPSQGPVNVSEGLERERRAHPPHIPVQGLCRRHLIGQWTGKEQAWHKADIDIRWNKVSPALRTHDEGGL
jgi:hypothetical protein